MTRALEILAALAFLALAPLLYQWPVVSWICFLCLLGCVAAPLESFSIGFSGPSAAGSAIMRIVLFGFGWGVLRAGDVDNVMATPLAILACQVVTTTFARLSQPARSAPWSSRERMGSLAILLAVALFMAGPFRGFGRDLGSAVGYPYLTVTDVFHHTAVVAELAKHVPPANPYFGGYTLHYYWLPHVIPAVLTDERLGAVPVATALQMAMLAYSLLASFLLLCFARSTLGVERRWIGVSAVAIFASSYVWLLSVAMSIARVADRWFPALNLGALLSEQGEEYSGLSHGPLRDFVTEPQGTLAFALILALLLHRRSSRSDRATVHTIGGILAGACFGVDGFLGIICAAWILLLTLSDCRQSERSLSRTLAALFVTGAGIVIAHAALYVVGVHGSGQSNVGIHPYYRMLALLPFLLFVEYGPLSLAAGVGTIRSGRALIKQLDLVILTLVTLPVMFLVRSDFVHNLVFRKGLRLLRLPLLVGSGLALDAASERRRVAICLGLAVLIALPSLAFDFQNLSRADGGDRSETLSRPDYEACLWLRKNTPRDAIVQGRPDYGFHSNFTPTIVVGERRAALGDYIRARNYQVGATLPVERAGELREIFGARDMNAANVIIDRLAIDFLYVGPMERRYYAAIPSRFREQPERFEAVYDSGEVTIFKVLRSANGATR